MCVCKYVKKTILELGLMQEVFGDDGALEGTEAVCCVLCSVIVHRVSNKHSTQYSL
jgi:hypothetical protein